MVSRVEIVSNGPAPHNLLVSVYFDSVNGVSVDLNANIRSLLTGPGRNNPEVIRAAASDWLQMLVDSGPPGNPTRVTLASLPGPGDDPDDPEGDPNKETDPGQPDYFWARASEQLGNGQNAVDIYRPTALVGGTATHIIARSFLVNFTYSGTDYTIQTETPPQELR